jgi:ethanolamine ammonia-lyase small subunit
MTPPDPWFALRRHTAARIALGRSGASLPTAPWLAFSLAHAQARDAVHQALDSTALQLQLAAAGWPTTAIESAAPDRASYLRRPDWGRRLSARSAAVLTAAAPTACQLAVVIADGLSARAAQSHALPLLLSLAQRLQDQAISLDVVLLAQQARVALGDEVGGLLRAQALLMLIGERPGLSSPDSLGAYITWAPQPGRSDAQRNCVSNIRPEGLPYAQAAHKIAWLLTAARRLGSSGVSLKDDSDRAAIAADVATRLPAGWRDETEH